MWMGWPLTSTLSGAQRLGLREPGSDRSDARAREHAQRLAQAGHAVVQHVVVGETGDVERYRRQASDMRGLALEDRAALPHGRRGRRQRALAVDDAKVGAAEDGQQVAVDRLRRVPRRSARTRGWAPSPRRRAPSPARTSRASAGRWVREQVWYGPSRGIISQTVTGPISPRRTRRSDPSAFLFYQVVRPGYWVTRVSGVRMVRPWTMAWLTIMRSKGSRWRAGSRET